ncbi:MAG: S9 family peptidase, partial [Pseudomonadota bacterium]
MTKLPVAQKLQHKTQINDIELFDDYAWMRDPKWPDVVGDPRVLEYLEEENSFAQHFFDENSVLVEKIFQELKGRIKLTDQSVYIKKDYYYYYSRT